jgi:hypothetical protein
VPPSHVHFIFPVSGTPIPGSLHQVAGLSGL